LPKNNEAYLDATQYYSHFSKLLIPYLPKHWEPLARFVRKLPKDSNCADEGFPELENRNFSDRFENRNFSDRSNYLLFQLSKPDKLVFLRIFHQEAAEPPKSQSRLVA